MIVAETKRNNITERRIAASSAHSDSIENLTFKKLLVDRIVYKSPVDLITRRRSSRDWRRVHSADGDERDKKEKKQLHLALAIIY